MQKYNTSQREILISFFKEHADELLSVNDIAAGVSDKQISKSAIYRNIAMLSDEGIIKHFVLEDSRKSCYRYISNRECKSHFHLTCKKCGKTMHMPKSTSEEIVNLIGENSAFKTDISQTVFFGLCENCK
ncbi:MAG: transcriptional repressor [Clostridiales bacterium]|nr:transcriptional repressor [Clostridiales bacterium]